MALRPEYALGRSQYNEFLFAVVGQEPTGQDLTTLTLLTRLEIDPWQEAARLADLPKDAAARAFTATIARLPQEDRRGWNLESIAGRVVAWLPAASIEPVPLMPGAPDRSYGRDEETKKAGLARTLSWAALAVIAILLAYHFAGWHDL